MIAKLSYPKLDHKSSDGIKDYNEELQDLWSQLVDSVGDKVLWKDKTRDHNQDLKPRSSGGRP